MTPALRDGDLLGHIVAAATKLLRFTADKSEADFMADEVLQDAVKLVQRLPRSLHAELVARARSEGTSLNTLITMLLAEGVGRAAGASGRGRS